MCFAVLVSIWMFFTGCKNDVDVKKAENTVSFQVDANEVYFAVPNEEQNPKAENPENLMREYKIMRFNVKTEKQEEVALIKNNFFKERFSFYFPDEKNLLLFLNPGGELTVHDLNTNEDDVMEIPGITPTLQYLNENTISDFIFLDGSFYYLKGDCSEGTPCSLHKFETYSGQDKIMISNLNESTKIIYMGGFMIRNYDPQTESIEIINRGGDGPGIGAYIYYFNPWTKEFKEGESFSYLACERTGCTEEYKINNEKFEKEFEESFECENEIVVKKPSWGEGIEIVYQDDKQWEFEDATFVSCGIGGAKISDQESLEAEDLSVLNYYLDLPSKYLEFYLEDTNDEERKSKIATLDLANYYIDLKDNVSAGGFTTGTVTVFMKPDKSRLTAVEGGDCTTLCFRDIYFLEYKNGEFIDVTKEYLPEIDFEYLKKKVHQKANYGTSVDSTPFSFYFELPREGTDIILYEYLTGMKVAKLKWTKGKFVPQILLDEERQQGSFEVETSDYTLTFPSTWKDVEAMGDFSGFCLLPIDGGPNDYQVTGRSQAFTIFDKVLFVIMQISADQKDEPCIPAEQKFIGVSGDKAYFYSPVTPDGYFSFLYEPLTSEEEKLMDDIDGIISTIKF